VRLCAQTMPYFLNLSHLVCLHVSPFEGRMLSCIFKRDRPLRKFAGQKFVTRSVVPNNPSLRHSFFHLPAETFLAAAP
jgi:hypothetical protein